MRDLGSVWDFSLTNFHEGSAWDIYLTFKHPSFDFVCINEKTFTNTNCHEGLIIKYHNDILCQVMLQLPSQQAFTHIILFIYLYN